MADFTIMEMMNHLRSRIEMLEEIILQTEDMADKPISEMRIVEFSNSKKLLREKYSFTINIITPASGDEFEKTESHTFESIYDARKFLQSQLFKGHLIVAVVDGLRELRNGKVREDGEILE